MNKFVDYESLFTYISLILAFAIFIVLMYGCIADNYNTNSNIIENFSTNEPVHAVIASMEVDATTKAIKTITLGTNKGKYYKDKPPTITIPKSTAIQAVQAEATAILKTDAISGSNPPLYEIASIQITSGKAGTEYSTTDYTKIILGPPIAEYKSASTALATEPVSAVIDKITVDATTKEIKTITLSANKGKYYKDKPPVITIGAPADITGTIAIAEVKLKTTPIDIGGLLYEIDTITIKEAGKKYATTDSDKITFEPISDYIVRNNPVITLTSEQKTNILDLINKCTALKNKTQYISKINSDTLRKTDVDAIINEVGQVPTTTA